MRLAVDERFWDKWEDKFLSNAEDYITPNEPEVKAAVSNAGVCDSCGVAEKADAVWEYVYDRVDYKLSDEWKEPKQTLEEGVGDCEDVSFLAASMLIRAGVEEFDYVIGYLESDGPDEKHTWLEVDGEIVDPTSPAGGNGGIEYTPEQRFVIKHD